MAEWIDLYHADPMAHGQLVDKAVSYLPVPRKSSRASGGRFFALSDGTAAVELVRATDPEKVARARSEVELYPTRAFANALINVAWRNGPVEDIHIGKWRGYPLSERRVSPAEERALMRFASDRMALGMLVCQRFSFERPARPYGEQVLPYNIATMMLITPSGWTLTEASREVRLSGY